MALLVLLLVHAPPGIVLLRVVVWVAHTVDGPVMAVGTGFTVTTNVVNVLPQPETDAVYVSVAVPTLTPVTTPDDEPTVAIPVLPLLHVPPPNVDDIVRV